MMWGARAGVQFALIELALKALPVLIIGVFSSIPGAIVGGLLVGAVEKILEARNEKLIIEAIFPLRALDNFWCVSWRICWW